MENGKSFLRSGVLENKCFMLFHPTSPQKIVGKDLYEHLIGLHCWGMVELDGCLLILMIHSIKSTLKYTERFGRGRKIFFNTFVTIISSCGLKTIKYSIQKLVS